MALTKRNASYMTKVVADSNPPNLVGTFNAAKALWATNQLGWPTNSASATALKRGSLSSSAAPHTNITE